MTLTYATAYKGSKGNHFYVNLSQQPAASSQQPLHIALGILFLFVGLLKLIRPGSAESTFIVNALPNWTLPLIPLYEIGLGVWLVSSWMRFGAWLTSLFTLCLFSLYNLELMTIGKSSCGCLGAVDASPKFMLVLDVVLLVVFLKRRQHWIGWPVDSPVMRQVLTTLAVMAGILGTMAAIGYARYGSLNVAVGDLRQEPLVVVPGDLNLGDAASGDEVERVIRVYNLTAESADLAYGKGSCSCATFPDLPIKVPANGYADVRVIVAVSGPPGRFSRAGIFKTNVGQVRFGIRAWVVDSQTSVPSSSKE